MVIQPIHIKLTPSKLILGLLGSVSIACCWIIIRLPIPVLFQLVIIALILVSSAYFIARDALLLLPQSWQSLEVDSKGALTLVNKSGQQFQPTLAASTFIHAACSVLNFERNGFKLALPPVILLTSSAENRDELRRLRVWLRWFKHQDDSVADLVA